MMRARQIAAWTALASALGGAWSAGAPAAGRVTFAAPVKLAGAAAGTEPRLAIGVGKEMWVITNDAQSGNAIVFRTKDSGATWVRTDGEPAGQSAASIDTDIAITPNGRLIAVELDGNALALVTSYSDNGGSSWTPSAGAALVDQDRPWLAIGPTDPITHQPRVYLLFHNLLSGLVQHNMYVSTSFDGGRNFDAPVPVTLPGDVAFSDLQCGDSGAPSGIAVDPQSGRIYASFGTRTSALGGCGASLLGTPEVNVVGETRIWVATSPDGSAGSWTTTLAADAGDKVVSASFEPVAVDADGHVFVAYAQTANPYPDFAGAAVRYVWSPAGGETWSKPVVVAPGGPAGRYDPSIVPAGNGNLGLAYYTGVPRAHGDPLWYVDVAVVRKAETGAPQVSESRLADLPAYAATANGMGGSCASGPTAGLENGLLCGRATDDWAVGLDPRCRLVVTFPTVANDGPGANPGTFVATQDGGPTVCGDAEATGTVRLVLGRLSHRPHHRLAVRVRGLGGTVRKLTVSLTRLTGKSSVRVARGIARSAGRHGTRVYLKLMPGAHLQPGRHRLDVAGRDSLGRRVRASRSFTVR